jgi:hypothetical protein
MSDQREPFHIVVRPGLWSQIEVAVTPPTITHSLRTFRDHEGAMTFAGELAKVTGWPVRDLVEREA